MKKTPKKTIPTSALQPVVLVILALLSGGIAVRFERSELRFELQIGKST